MKPELEHSLLEEQLIRSNGCDLLHLDAFQVWLSVQFKSHKDRL